MVTETNPVSSLLESIKSTTLDSTRKPHLVFGASAADGHTNPSIKIADGLIQRGFEVTFIGGSQFESSIKAIGAEHVAIPPLLNPKLVAERGQVPPGIPRLIFDIDVIFLGTIAEKWAALKKTLETLREQDPTREIVVVTESMFLGAIPMILGAPLPKGFKTRPKVVSLHVVPYMATSIDTGPFGPGLPPDSTESGRARSQLINQMLVGGPFAGSIALQEKLLKELGATEVLGPEVPFHHWMLVPDVTLQMCPPSLEYSRSDMPSHVKFAGCLLPKPMPVDFVYPEWWNEVTKGDKKVVVVTQGTIATDYNDLLIPTLRALSSHSDLLVMAILGSHNAILPPTTTIPSNARVIDYLAYDAILPYASVFVMNAGYGGFLHAMTHGIPMVLAGETEDKPEIAMRGEWAGIAVNLRTGKPTEGQVVEGVERVLQDGRFKERVEEVRRENARMGVFDVVEREILGVLE